MEEMAKDQIRITEVHQITLNISTNFVTLTKNVQQFLVTSNGNENNISNYETCLYGFDVETKVVYDRTSIFSICFQI